LSLAQYARDSGRFTAEKFAEWFRDIDKAIATGRYLFVLPQFVVRGVKHNQARSSGV